jgi:tRNA pseudouridine38-40 synthase
MRNVRLEIAYDGSEYAGWQRQAGADTIQEQLERAIYLICQVETTVHGSGRTDSGVHALAQTAHVRISRGPACETLHRALNSVLPEDIRVLSAWDMEPEFHARFSARGKRYVYRICTDSVLHPMLRRYVHQQGQPLDLEAMRRAAQSLLGTHDFASFAANPGVPRKRPTVRTLTALHLLRRRWGIELFVQGDGFLYNMVRILAGTLIEVGKGKVEPEQIREILDAKDRTRAGPTLPARGLAMLRALYSAEFSIPGLRGPRPRELPPPAAKPGCQNTPRPLPNSLPDRAES